jgi:molybdate transport system substrate-binding protein
MKNIVSYSFRIAALSSCAIMLLCGSLFAQNSQEKIYIYAAASTKEAVIDLVNAYKKDGRSKAEFVTSFGSSGDLARQIENGADANIFISADTKWTKYLDEKKLVEKGTASNFASNTLVLIASPKAKTSLKFPEQLFEAIGEGYLAMGDPKPVPAGKYGQEALTYHKLWDKISGAKKIAFYPDVRKTLNAVETSQADYGIVYKTDAKLSANVKVVYTFTKKSHSPIDYPVCGISGKAGGEAAAFLKFLKKKDAKKILEKYGFAVK